jgi:hypothetical protein
MSRPSKLTTETQEQLCALIARGNTRTDAAACAGVSYGVIKHWVRLGKKARREGKRDRYLAFLTALEKADSDCRKKLVSHVWRAAAKNWRAAAYLLGCKAPDDYGPFLHVLRAIQKDIAELKKARHADDEAVPDRSPPPESDSRPGG